ncbi:MAG TPA: monovalent cation/H+ antiporter complex subunit F [Rhodopila sp.]
MNPWLAADVALLPALAVPLWIAARGSAMNRLAAVQFATLLAGLIGIIFSFASDQPSIIDLLLALALLSLPGSLLLAHFLERWL